VFLHGGWGYEIYPLDAQMSSLASHHRFIVPDRSGYGRSGAIGDLPPDFHRRALVETRAVVDALGLERPILWGHSDGAIVALLFGLAAPDRIAGAIVEAPHYYTRKPGSRAFFETMLANPRSALGASVVDVLARDHGDRWPAVVELHSRAWLRIGDEAAFEAEDFYGGRLPELALPLLVVHGLRDPRTEPGELDALQDALPRARFHIPHEGGHSPHSERATADGVTEAIAAFVADVAPVVRPTR
jgi:pimeloyl-ACP methyl ester carboxylesterase